MILQKLAVLGCLLAAVCAVAQEPEPVVIVQFRVNASFSETPDALAAFEQTLKALPSREIAVKPGESINELIDRLFDWGQSDRPKSFVVLEDSIQELNAPSYIATTKTGKVLIPDVPDWALADYNPEKAANFVPQIGTWTSAQISMDAEGQPLLKGAPKIVASGRKASQFALREYRATLSEADAILERGGDLAKPFNYPMGIELAAPPAPAQDLQPLSDQQRPKIKQLLDNPSRKSLVILADTGWPDATSRETARKLLLRVINVVREKALLLPPLQKVNLGAFTALQQPHAARIQKALAPFVELDTKKAVEVIYVPVTKGQGAEPLLKELIETYYLLRLVQSVEGKTAPTADDVKVARDNATAILKNVPADWPAGRDKLLTDKVVIDAYLALTNEFAERADIPMFFFNESWTVPHKKFSVVHPDPLRGAVVAAGGNANENLSDGTVDFAQRSIRHKDTIAVMNIDDAGIACTSATLALDDLPHAFVVAFDGRVGPNNCDDSGTSFAAPRIAWLFAAGEAIRKTSFPHGSWGNRQHDYIKTLRNPANALLGTRLDPVAFLEGIAALP